VEGALALARPWQVLARAATAAGALELRQRGEGDFLIAVDGRVLMNSRAARSEVALGELAVAGLAERAAPRVLIGGLGMGITLRAALDRLPPGARVLVVELVPAVVEWCRGPLRALTGGAVLDPRVSVEIGDVAAALRPNARLDAIALDLFEGPDAAGSHAWSGPAGLARARAALAPAGVLAVWSERPDPAFERRLEASGFAVERSRPGRGGLRHAVYRAVRGPDTPGGRSRGRAVPRRP
jgi:spermidine synthase